MKIALLALLGLMLGALGGALLFGVIAARDAEIAVRREPARKTAKSGTGPHLCNAKTRIALWPNSIS